MIEFIKKWKDLKIKKQAVKKEITNNEYLQRLKNSCRDFSGMSHSCSGRDNKKYLTMSEFSSLLFKELERKESKEVKIR